MRETSMQKIIIGICYGILFLIMATVVLRLFARFVLVKGLGMEEHMFVKAIFFDSPALQKSKTDIETTETGQIEIDWETLYPFPAENTGAEKKMPLFFKELDRMNAKASSIKESVLSIEDKFSKYSGEFLMGRNYFQAGKYYAEKAAGWDISGFKEYNAVVTLKDGRLTSYCRKSDVTEHVESLMDFKEYCEESGSDFLYVQNPYAICKEENPEVSGIQDFSNQNADALLGKLRAGGVECLDMRKCLHEDGLSHADAFFRTDHHWKPETGLWAAGKLAAYLNEKHEFSIDTSLLEKDKFTYDVYSSCFLGSKGRKLWEQIVEPEDFTMLYPKYETKLYYEIPTKDIAQTGDFAITYDMECIGTTEDYFYGAYNHGDNAVMVLRNLLDGEDGKRILIIKDSFMDVVIPFLACADGVSKIDVLDVRYFNGSVKAFVKEKKPDIVIVAYYADAFTMHVALFDFR